LDAREVPMQAYAEYVTIDGRRFHYVWLRDNCPCSACRDTSSFQKIYDVCERDVTPASLEVGSMALVMRWKDDPTPHAFPLAWLAANAYDREMPEQAGSRYELWDRSALAAKSPQIAEFGRASRDDWVDQLWRLGFVRVGNLPYDRLKEFVASIGPVSYYARQQAFVPVKIIPGGEDLSMSSFALSPHTDQSYMTHTHPMLLLLYCIENGARGGESTLVDGFRVVKDLRRERPDDYAILCETPVTFAQLDPSVEYFFARTTPVIETDGAGGVVALHWSHKNFTVDLPFDKMARYYEAYKSLLSRLKSPGYEYVFRLEPGQCLLVENDRVLHGRRAFDPNSGTRHFTTAFVAWDYVAARHNYPDRAALERRYARWLEESQPQVNVPVKAPA
jgi:gamma-butyrobetaine dioxygenase